ncbi:MAG: 30S ribosomal protein S8 [Thermofilaceae archaeon]
MLTDVLANAIATIKNNEVKGRSECLIYPSSKLVMEVLKVLQRNGYVGEIEYIEDGRGGKLKVQLLGKINDCGVVKPRHSVKHHEIDRWKTRFLPARDVGILVLSTSHGILSHHEAEELKIGGILLAYVY